MPVLPQSVGPTRGDPHPRAESAWRSCRPKPCARRLQIHLAQNPTGRQNSMSPGQLLRQLSSSSAGMFLSSFLPGAPAQAAVQSLTSLLSFSRASAPPSQRSQAYAAEPAPFQNNRNIPSSTAFIPSIGAPFEFKDGPLLPPGLHPGSSTRPDITRTLQRVLEEEPVCRPSSFITETHPVLNILEARRASQCRPGVRSDNYKLGLVVEGGGMRGAISGAMLMWMHQQGFGPQCFDAVYGASAGAINACYYLSGQQHGLDIYWDDLTRGGAFIDLGVMWRSGLGGLSEPVMKLDFLLDYVMNNTKPLDWEAVLSSPTPLKVVASSIDDLRSVVLTDFTTKHDLVEALKAGATVPQFAGPPRVVGGKRLVDAAVFEPVPVQSALRDGCTHVLVLCTRPEPPRSRTWRRRMVRAIERAAKTTILNAGYMKEAWRTSLDASDECCPQEHLASALRECPHAVQQRMGGYVLPVYPETTGGCHPICLNPATLKRAIEEGYSAMDRVVNRKIVSAAAAAASRAGSGVRTVAGAGAGPTSGSGSGSAGMGSADGDALAESLVPVGLRSTDSIDEAEMGLLVAQQQDMYGAMSAELRAVEQAQAQARSKAGGSSYAGAGSGSSRQDSSSGSDMQLSV